MQLLLPRSRSGCQRAREEAMEGRFGGGFLKDRYGMAKGNVSMSFLLHDTVLLEPQRQGQDVRLGGRDRTALCSVMVLFCSCPSAALKQITRTYTL